MRVTANALGDAARKGNVTPTMLRRMIAMRNWLPDEPPNGCRGVQQRADGRLHRGSLAVRANRS
jgi:hypothetical protein